MFVCYLDFFFFFSSRRRHTRLVSDWSSDVCSSDLLVITAANEALAFERGDVLVHRGQGSQAQSAGDLLEAGRVAVLIHEIDQEIEDFFLSLGERHGLSPRSRHSIGRIKGERQCEKQVLQNGLPISPSRPT